MTEHHAIVAQLARSFRMFDSHLRRLALSRAARTLSAPIQGNALTMNLPTCDGAGADAAGQVAEDAWPRRTVPTFLLGELRIVG